MASSPSLFSTRRFWPLFLTQFFGAFNDNVFKNAFLIWFTYEAAATSDMDASLVVTLAAGLFILPFFLFSATAGQLVDKYEKAFLTRRIKLVEIALMAATAIGFYFQSVPWLLTVLFCMGAQSSFFGPIKYSLLPEHLHDHELVQGNSYIEGGTFLAILLGTIFGGLIITIPSGVVWLSLAVVGIAVIGWLSSRAIPSASVGDPQLKIGWNIARETGRIITYARKDHSLWLPIIGISWFWLVGATFLTQFPIYTANVLYGNEHIVTLLLTMFSIGIGVGAILCSKLQKGAINGRWVPVGCVGLSVWIGLLCVASHYYGQIVSKPTEYYDISSFLALGPPTWGVLGSLLALAIVAGIYIVPLYTLMQHSADPSHLARVIAANNVMNALFMVLGSVAVIALYAVGLRVEMVILTLGFANIPMCFIIRGVGKNKTPHQHTA